MDIAIVTVVAAVSGILLGWTARAREIKKDVEQEASTDTALKMDVDYIKKGVDDIRVDMRVYGQRVDSLSERVTRVEESSKQAHKRIDRLEGIAHE